MKILLKYVAPEMRTATLPQDSFLQTSPTTTLTGNDNELFIFGDPIRF